MNSSSNAARFRLWQALAASLALHALLAAQTLSPSRSAHPDPPLAATLRPPLQRTLQPDAEAAPTQRPPLQTQSASARRAPAAETAPVQREDRGAEQGDAEGLRSYRFGLARSARGLSRYPAPALASGLGGRVAVRLDVGAGGKASPPQLVASSGYSLLDAAALDLVARAAAATAVPERLRGSAFSVVLPLEFDPGER